MTRWTHVVMPKLGFPVPHRLPSLRKGIPEVCGQGDRSVYSFARQARGPVALCDCSELSLCPKGGSRSEGRARADPSCPFQHLADSPEAGGFAGSVLLGPTAETAAGPGGSRSERHQLDQRG